MRWHFLSKTKYPMLMGRLLALLMVGALALSTLAAAPGSGKGGQKGRNKPSSSTGQCSVTPNPVQNGKETFTVNGSGFTPGITVDVLVAGGMYLFGVVDDSGNFYTSAWAAFTQTGTQEIKVYKMGDKRETVLATCSFMVD